MFRFSHFFFSIFSNFIFDDDDMINNENNIFDFELSKSFIRFFIFSIVFITFVQTRKRNRENLNNNKRVRNKKITIFDNDENVKSKNNEKKNEFENICFHCFFR